MTSLNKYVDVSKDLASGVPVFKGTRVAVKTLFDYLEEESLEEFTEDYNPPDNVLEILNRIAIGSSFPAS